jgi:hypothetical protein
LQKNLEVKFKQENGAVTYLILEVLTCLRKKMNPSQGKQARQGNLNKGAANASPWGETEPSNRSKLKCRTQRQGL